MAAGLYANQLATRRTAVGIDSAAALANRVDIDLAWYELIEAGEVLPTFGELSTLCAVLGTEPGDLYPRGLLNVIGARRTQGKRPDFRTFYQSMADVTRLLVSREEVGWLERATSPDRQVPVFVNMSCGTQIVPHLMLDTVSALQALGVEFGVGVGQELCCGAYHRQGGYFAAADHMRASSQAVALSWGAQTMVHWCTNCVNVYGEATTRARLADGTPPPLRHVQVLAFLIELLTELGDEVPWQREIPRRVAVHGHGDLSPIHDAAMRNVARLLEMVPGVEVVGFLDNRTVVDNFCNRNPANFRVPFPATAEEMEQRRKEIAALVRDMGADTVSAQHQDCQGMWSQFASRDLAVRHAVSIVAEALGVDNPDRFQAAALLGDPRAVVDQTRPAWSTWGLTEEEAHDIARATGHQGSRPIASSGRLFNPLVGSRGTTCTCGRGGCGQQLISIDVLRGIDWRAAQPR